MSKQRHNYLSVTEQFNLEHACRMLSIAGFTTYQVGSSLERPDYRDVDLRCIMADGEYDRFIGCDNPRLQFLNVCISEWLAARTGLPIDFQFQRRTEANAQFDGKRNFVGMRADRPPEPKKTKKKKPEKDYYEGTRS